MPLLRSLAKGFTEGRRYQRHRIISNLESFISLNSVALLRFAHADSFLSGAGREADKKMGHQAGANAYVIKPDVSHLLGGYYDDGPNI